MRQSRRTRIFRKRWRRYNYERGGKIGGAIGDLYQSALGMIRRRLIAVMSGGTSAAAQGGSTLAGAADDIVSNITRQLTKNAGYMSSFASTVGTDYERAKAAGAIGRGGCVFGHPIFGRYRRNRNHGRH